MKYKILDNSNETYPIIETVKYGKVTVNPSSEYIIKGNYVIFDDNLAEKGIDPVDKGYHAIRCQCNNCKGKLSKLINMMKDDGVKIVDSNDTQAVKNVFGNLNKGE